MRSMLPGWLLIGLCAVAYVWPSRAHAQTSNHGMHPPMPDQQYYIQVQLDREGGPVMIDELVKLSSPSAAAELDQVLAVPAPLSRIRLTRYLPQGTLTQTVVADETPGGGPAIQLSIDGPTQSHQRWLVADDRERNRLSSFIANWRYMSVADSKQRKELCAQFENELTREARLLVSSKDGILSHEFVVEPGAAHSLDDLGCKLIIKEFYPHFATDGEPGGATNLSDKRINPAALIEIEYKGKKEERWLFARFPEYSQNKSQALPFTVTLDSPVDTQRDLPDFVLVTTDRSKHEVWTRYKGAVKSKQWAMNERVAIGDTQYTFRMAQFVASGRLVEDYQPAKGRGGVPVLRFRTMDASGRELAKWLPAGGQHILSTALGPMKIAFGPRQAALHGEKP